MYRSSLYNPHAGTVIFQIFLVQPRRTRIPRYDIIDAVLVHCGKLALTMDFQQACFSFARRAFSHSRNNWIRRNRSKRFSVEKVDGVLRGVGTFIGWAVTLCFHTVLLNWHTVQTWKTYSRTREICVQRTKLQLRTHAKTLSRPPVETAYFSMLESRTQ